MTTIHNFNINWYKELGSTNLFLNKKLNEKKFDEYHVICTSSQIKGKGQGANKWESEPNKNLTFSLLIKPIFIEIQDQFIISKAISLAIIKALNNYKPGFCIKWPNDIYYNKKKIAGILIENSLSANTIKTSIIGIGLNINQIHFLSDAPNPISLAQIICEETNIDKILNEILLSFDLYYQMIKDGNSTEIDTLYFNALFRKDGDHTYKDEKGTFSASIKDISSFGHLILETNKGEEKIFAFKEVEFIL